MPLSGTPSADERSVVKTRGSDTAALGRVTHEHDVLTALGDHESEPLIERLRSWISVLDAKGHSTTGRCCSFDDGLDDEGANSPSLLIRQQLKVPNREVPVLSCDVDQPDALSARDPDRLHPSAAERATANPTVFAFGPVHYQLDL